MGEAGFDCFESSVKSRGGERYPSASANLDAFGVFVGTALAEIATGFWEPLPH
jgi:hypothetical protein